MFGKRPFIQKLLMEAGQSKTCMVKAELPEVQFLRPISPDAGENS